MKIINTHTGKIFVDTERKLEFLTVGDYGKENNIKANFLGLHKEIYGVQHHAVDLCKKWVATISTQKGCPMRCRFCDCPKYGSATIHRNVLCGIRGVLFAWIDFPILIKIILNGTKRKKITQTPCGKQSGKEITISGTNR